jgi:hypothetical protein
VVRSVTEPVVPVVGILAQRKAEVGERIIDIHPFGHERGILYERDHAAILGEHPDMRGKRRESLVEESSRGIFIGWIAVVWHDNQTP